jgi:peptidoglycan/xylan/chitin deacetylase (PgdA/CDA1 family)
VRRQFIGRFFGATSAALFAAACTTMNAPPPRSEPIPPAPRAVIEPPKPVVLARTEDFVIVRVMPGDTYATLASTYLGDASLAEFVADANPAPAPQPGRAVVVPLKAVNASGVFTDGYQTVPVLCYHQFTAGKSTDLMVMPRDSFTQQMEYLKSNNFHVISLAQLQAYLDAARPVPPRSVVITVDDGFRSAYDIAYPILKAYGYPATFFIYTDFVGGGRALTWAQINEMRASGLIEIESHSKTHTTFSPGKGENEKGPAYAARLTTEIDTPQKVLERQIGGSIRVIAYPYGDTSQIALQLLHDRNYSLALTVTRGGNASFSDPLVLRRDMIYGNATIADFQKSLRVYSRVDLK